MPYADGGVVCFNSWRQGKGVSNKNLLQRMMQLDGNPAISPVNVIEHEPSGLARAFRVDHLSITIIPQLDALWHLIVHTVTL